MSIATKEWLMFPKVVAVALINFLVFFMGLFFAVSIAGALWFITLGHCNVFEWCIDVVAVAYEKTSEL